MRRTVIQTGTSWEGNTGVEAIFFDELEILGLNPVRDVHNAHARPDERLSVLPRLAMHLSCSSELLIIGLKQALLGLQLRARHSVIVMIEVVRLDLSNGEVAIGELLRDWDRIVNGLFPLSRAPIAQHTED